MTRRSFGFGLIAGLLSFVGLRSAQAKPTCVYDLGGRLQGAGSPSEPMVLTDCLFHYSYYGNEHVVRCGKLELYDGPEYHIVRATHVQRISAEEAWSVIWDRKSQPIVAMPMKVAGVHDATPYEGDLTVCGCWDHCACQNVPTSEDQRYLIAKIPPGGTVAYRWGSGVKTVDGLTLFQPDPANPPLFSARSELKLVG